MYDDTPWYVRWYTVTCTMKHQVIKDDNRDMKYDNHSINNDNRNMNEDNHSMNKENRI